MKTDYEAIQTALDRAVAAVQEEINFLTVVKADQNIIDSLQADIVCIDRAAEIIKHYKELES